MKKLRVGVWLQGKLRPEFGGAYSYCHELVRAMNEYSFTDAEIVFLNDGVNYAKEIDCKRILWKSRHSNILKSFLKLTVALHPFGKGLRKKIEKLIEEDSNKLKSEIYQYADIIYYPTQSCTYPDFPYIYTLWDLGHLNTYAFPELCMDGNFESREKHHSLLTHKAMMVFAESETGKKECEKYIHTNENRIKVVPIFPSGVVSHECVARKPKKMDKSDMFIHYPAQYWAHKNHYNLFMAMPRIIKAFPEIKLLLTGADKGNKDYLSKIIAELNIEKNILNLGFVSLEEMRWLYENSHGLVMPTLLGPTNMPPVEAAVLGCPVACTNLPGHVEQLGNYGYYFDGLNPNDIAKQVIQMITDKKNGKIKKYDNIFTIDTAMKAIDSAFTELRPIRHCWEK